MISRSPHGRRDVMFGPPQPFWLKPFPVRTCTVFFPFTSVSGFALSKCLQPSFLCFCASLFVLMATDRVGGVKMHCTLHCLPNVGSPHGSGDDLDGMGTRFGRKTRCLSVKNLYTSERRSLKFRLSQHGCPAWIHISRKHLEISRVDLQRWNRISMPSLQVCATSRHMLPQHQTFPVRQDPGLHSNMLTAPQPQGPMAQGHLMTIETHDEDLILPQAQKMKNHEVPSYSDSLVNNISKELQSGPIPFGMNPICKLEQTCQDSLQSRLRVSQICF